MENKQKPPWILYMGTFPPRECGIATFTKDLTTAINKKFSSKVKSKILAMNRSEDSHKYPDDVILQINENDIQGYIDAAKKINKINAIKLVNIQHEFGIFGGYYGKYLLKFIETLNKPIIITFHTVVPDAVQRNDVRKRVVQAIAKKAKCIIVLNELAVNILKKDYGIDNSKIVVIHHGIHDVQYEDSIKEKTKLGYEDRIILSTFGFIRKSKGYEYMINALSEVIDKFPNVLYLIVGKVHPAKKGDEGKGYLKFLKDRVKELGLRKNVKFINRYVRLNELIKYLKATDLYLCHTKNEGQIVSGTLSYAMGCGRAVVSTSFLHGKEAVTPERGILVEIGNTKSFEEAIIKLLSNPELRKRMGRNAYEYTRHMTWENVANSYMKVFSRYLK